METQQEVVSQDPVLDLKAERVQGELAGVVAGEEPFRISLKAERVQEPSSFLASLGEASSLSYEMSFNQMRTVRVDLAEPQIAIHLFATGGQEAA